jgi:hypothetical protein
MLRCRSQVFARNSRMVNQTRLLKINQRSHAGIKAYREEQKFPDSAHLLFIGSQLWREFRGQYTR